MKLMTDIPRIVIPRSETVKSQLLTLVKRNALIIYNAHVRSPWCPNSV